MEYVNRHFIGVQLQAQQRMGSKHYALFRITAAQQSNILKELLDHKTLLGCEAAYYINTIFGPVGASVGYSNHTRKPYVFVNLGFEF